MKGRKRRRMYGYERKVRRETMGERKGELVRIVGEGRGTWT